MVTSDADREDVIQAALTKIWTKRTQFKPTSVGAWFQFAARTSYRTAIDAKRVDQGVVVPEDGLDEVKCDEPFIETMALLASSRRGLYRVADEALLKLDPSIPVGERPRRLLAAQLLYLHESTPAEIIKLLGGAKPISRPELDGWLMDPGTVRSFAYQSLYRSNDDLLSHVFGLPAEECARLARQEGAPPGWSPVETQIAVLRLRNGLTTEKICRMVPGATKELVEATAAKCRAKFPFEAIAKDLQWKLRDRVDLLSDRSVWKRLVFQYHAQDELPQLQILERVQPSAALFGVALTPQVLNGWLSIGRLFIQLEKYVRSSNIDDTDD